MEEKIKSDLLFDLNDITIIPEITTTINSRSEINPYTSSHTLPIIAAPMDTVVGLKNYHLFVKEGINVCIPRTFLPEIIKNKIKINGDAFVSIGLDDIHIINTDFFKNISNNILIDIANGHMKKLINAIKLLKNLNPKINLMVGNVANPKTYKILSEVGADLVRISIGSGQACLTSVQTAINYPIGSLIYDCVQIKNEINGKPAKIIADGGMKNYSDIIKALALGADYVMVGSLLNKTIESIGKNYLHGVPINQNIAEFLYKKLMAPIKKKFRGMSTKEVQRDWGNGILKTSEGVTRIRRVEYTLAGWTENFLDYLKSAMSYTNSKTLDEFIGNVIVKLITQSALNRIKK
ncbi:MAG: IMP dehydrogenase [bacterium]